jgi:hypothetical protein
MAWRTAFAPLRQIFLINGKKDFYTNRPPKNEGIRIAFVFSGLKL